MNTVLKKAAKVVCFVLIFILLYSGVSNVLCSTEDYRHTRWLSSFENQKKNSLDAVYIGSSAAYAFWCAPLAWHDYGITVHSYTTSGQRVLLSRYALEQARKKQKNALFIINMNTLQTSYTEAHVHYLSDELSMLNPTKYRLVNAVADYTGFEKKSFLLPLNLYHTRWSSLNENDFDSEPDKYMGAPSYSSFLKKKKNITKTYQPTSEEKTPSGKYMAQLKVLLDYIEKKNIKVLFVFSCQGIDADRIARFNYLSRYLTEKGFDVLNMFDDVDGVGVDFKTDYYNDRHTNIHGAIKTTDYLAKYLVEHYGFTDKRGDDAYSAWDEAYEQYYSLIKEYVS